MAELSGAATSVLDLAQSEGWEVVRLSFVDQHGVLRGKTLTMEALAGALRDGVNMTSTLLLKDTSHRTVFPVWAGGGPGIGAGLLDGAGDIVMRPDPTTAKTLPHAPHCGWILCDLEGRDGTPLSFSSRGLLKQAETALAAQGMSMLVGLEVEFHLFRVTDPHLDHADSGMPASPPDTALLVHGYQYLTEARYAAMQPILDQLRRHAQALGLPLRSVEVEFGPGQVEMTFAPQSPLAQADALILFRAMVKEVCAAQGLHATFMCRPALPYTVPSGWHLHQSVSDADTGRNLFQHPDGGLTDTAHCWIAGLLDHARSSCLLSTPTINGYKRVQSGMLAPDRVQWGRDNKGAMLRALIGKNDPASRIENRIAESGANPYLFIASQILAGLDGVKRGLTAPAPTETPYASDAQPLPRTLADAIPLFEASPLFQDAWGEEVVRWLAHIKRAEWDRFMSQVTAWEQAEYFTLL